MSHSVSPWDSPWEVFRESVRELGFLIEEYSSMNNALVSVQASFAAWGMKHFLTTVVIRVFCLFREAFRFSSKDRFGDNVTLV